MTDAEHLCTTLPLEPGGGPCEAVVLTSRQIPGGAFEASAVRTWITDLNGTGFEADGTDPAGLDAFHADALAELHRRRRFDFEVADLFALSVP